MERMKTAKFRHLAAEHFNLDISFRNQTDN